MSESLGALSKAGPGRVRIAAFGRRLLELGGLSGWVGGAEEVGGEPAFGGGVFAPVPAFDFAEGLDGVAFFDGEVAGVEGLGDAGGAVGLWGEDFLGDIAATAGDGGDPDPAGPVGVRLTGADEVAHDKGEGGAVDDFVVGGGDVGGHERQVSGRRVRF